MKKVKTLRTFYSKAKQYELYVIGTKAVRMARTKAIYDVIKLKVDALEAVLTLFLIALQDALGGSLADTMYKDQVMGQTIDAMDSLSLGLDDHCNNDPLFIVYLGLKVQTGPQTHEGDPRAPTNLVATTTIVEGQVVVTYEIPDPSIVSTVMFELSEDNVDFEHAGSSSSMNRTTLVNLPSRKEVYIRCYCVATGGRQSPYSQTVGPVFVF